MYNVRYWSYNVLRSKVFQSLNDAVMFSIYHAPFQSVETIKIIKE